MTEASSGSAPLRVLVVDPDDRVRESLAGLLAIGDRCVVVGSASDGAEALALVSASAPDVVIFDPRLPGVDGARALVARVHELSPATRVVVMATAGTAETPIPDADGFIRKTFRPRELVDALVAVGRPGT